MFTYTVYDTREIERVINAIMGCDSLGHARETSIHEVMSARR